MSAASARGETAGRLGLWLAAGSAVVGAHLLAAAWALQRPVAALPDAPEAITIDLAPAPPAPVPVAPVLPELQSFAPPEIPQAEPQPEPEPEDIAEPVAPILPDLVPMPVPDFPETLPPPVIEPPSDAVLLVSQRPLRRPEVREVRRQQPDPQPQRRAEPQPEQPRRQQAAPQPAPEAQEQQASPAPQGNGQARSRAAASPRAIANWQGEVQARVASHMRRASLSGARGTLRATVQVNVAANGRASGQLTAGTGNARIDNALARHARRMPRLPAPPNGQSVTLTVPVSIQVR
ncbi:MAG: TonB C-terminal domain-containing protein [Paracoccus sp. (in: a-proteobacteria)]